MITLETPTALLVNRVVSKGDVHLSGFLYNFSIWDHH